MTKPKQYGVPITGEIEEAINTIEDIYNTVSPKKENE